MASTYTDELRIEKIGTGEQTGTWGTTTNTQYDLFEAAISGTVSMTHDDSADDTLTTANGSDDEARHMAVLVGGTLTANRNLVCPTKSKLYIIDNNTTGGFTVTLKTTAGTGIAVPSGKRMFLYCDGTNVVDAFEAVNITGGTITGITDLVVADGGTGASTLTDGGILLGSGTDPVTAMSALADGEIVVGDGTTDPVALAAFSSSTGTLKVANGGTGAATLGDGYILLGSGTSAVTALDVTAKGSILVGDGTTDPVALAVGSNGQAIIADSAQTEGIKWGTAAGQFTFLSRTTLSTDATYDESSTYTGYDAIFLHLMGVRPDTNNVNLYLRISTSSTVQTGSTYDSAAKAMDSGGNDYDFGSNNDSAMLLHSDTPRVGNTATFTGFCGWIAVYNINDTGKNKGIRWALTYQSNAAGNRPQHLSGGGSFDGNQDAIDALQLYFSSGNLEDGIISAWGLNQS